MVDGAVLSLVKDVLGRLTSVEIQEFGLICGFKDDVLALKDDFDRIEVVLQDAVDRHKEKVVELWLKSVRSVSMEVEDLMDEISIEDMIQRLHKEKGIIYNVSAFFSFDHNPLMFEVKIAKKLDSIKQKLHSIASKIFDLKLTPSITISDVHVGVEGEMPHREIISNIHSSHLIFGRNDDMNMVIEKICNKDVGKQENGKIRVYGICGMSGVGKTTLAHLVYNHERVNKYFELKFWMNVSKNCKVKEIIKELIEFIDKRKCGLPELDMMQESLQSKLRGKKFFIVLDDVWIEDSEKTQLDQLSETLSCGAEGSIIVITTQSKTTNQIIAKVPQLQHELGRLSEEDAWLIFKKLAFAEGREGDGISELEPIGRDLVKKCEGIPLALKTLGGLMWSKRSKSDWQRMKDDNIWELRENDILPSLKLCYDNLLPHVKRCFAYCCLFRKGYELEKDVLITLWVSNGFIPLKGETSFYVLGEETLNCLVWRSFISKVKKPSGDIYIMHEQMHDMARHVMGDDCLIIEHGNEVIIPNEVLHLSSSCPGVLFSPRDLGKLTSLRSRFMFENIKEGSISQIFNHMYLRVLYLQVSLVKTLPESIFKLKHLKYLNLSHSSIEVLPDSIIYLQNLQVLNLYSCQKLYELPDSICKLKHLLYLNLSHSGVEFLPESIIHLQNLQVLLLSCCSNLSKLPNGLRSMTNLQRLDINSCYMLRHLPTGIKELTSLRILSLFRVGGENGAKLEELGNLNLLEGGLEIVPLENVGGRSEAKSANLKCKKSLEVLLLRWSNVRMYMTRQRHMRIAHDEEVLEGLEPNPSLKELKIYFCMGKTLSPSWMVKLRNLVEICFYYCQNCEHIPHLGRLPNLRVIRMSYMDSLKCLHDDKDNMCEDTDRMFLCLQKLEIYDCPNLVSLPSKLPKLEILKLVRCDGLLSIPDEIQSFKDLNTLVIVKCKHLSERCAKEIGVDWPKISHIPNIYQN